MRSTTSDAGKVVAIAGVSLRRLFRDRSNIFWVIISPLLFVFVLGLLFGGGQAPRLGVAGGEQGPLSQRLAGALAGDDRIEVVNYDDPESLRTDVERGLINGAVVVPPDYDQQLRAGDQVAVTWLARAADPGAATLQTWVRSVVAQESAVLRAAQFGVAEGAAGFDQALQAAEAVPVPGVTVTVTAAGETQYSSDLSQFAPLAPSMLLLFIFLTSLTAALGVIEARRLGVTGRMLASPTPVRAIVAGEALGRFGIALLQGLIVMLGSALLFGVDWGDPLGATAVLLLFCLVGSGAAMLLAATFRSEGPALGMSLGLGLGLASAGGLMVPLEVLGDTAQTIARFTPHAWGYQAYAELVRHDAGLTGILPELGVLAGFAVALFGLGTWLLRRSLSSAG